MSGTIAFVRHTAPLASVRLSGGVLPQAHVSWLEAGPPQAPAVLVLHGTAGSAESLLAPAFAQPLFGPGGPWDTTRWRVLVPDALGCGASSKPSDGLGLGFPAYGYDDQVDVQARWCGEVLGLQQLSCVLGYSMGGMQAWRWAARRPLEVSAVVALAASPVAMGGRNWMLRRLLIEQLAAACDDAGGWRPEQARTVRLALAQFQAATSGGEAAWQRRVPMADAAEPLLVEMVDNSPSQPVVDLLFQWRSSQDYPGVTASESVMVPVLAVHAEGDERNPGAVASVQALVRRGAPVDLQVVQEGPASAGHATLLQGSLWADAATAWMMRVLG